MSEKQYLIGEEEKDKNEPFSEFRESNAKIKKQKCITKLLLLLLFLILFIIIIILIVFFKADENDYNEEDKINELLIKYQITNIYNTIKLFDISSTNIIYSIISMSINDKEIKPIEKYKFNKTGIYTVKIKLKNNLTSIQI